MMYLAIGLFIVAIIILFVDIYIEGFGPLGVVGLLLAAASLFISVAFVPAGLFIVLGKLGLMVPGTVLFYRFLRVRQMHGKLILHDTLNEDVQDVSGLAYFLGKEGVASTALRPYGTADFNGNRVDVCSQSKYIPAGKRVKVVEVKERKVFVSLVENAN